MSQSKGSDATGAAPLPAGVDLEGFVPSAVAPSPIGHLTRKQRAQRIIGLMELAACHGDTRAGEKCLEFYRWEEEMKKGKPPIRSDAPAATEPVRVVINSIGVSPDQSPPALPDPKM